MSSKIHTVLISTLGIVFLFAGMAFAKTRNIDVIYHATVGKNLKLEPGHYKINVTNTKKSAAVKFYNHYGKFVGQAPVKVASISRKNTQTQVDYSMMASNKHAITEISPSGWKENLYFSKMSKSTSKN